MTTPPPRDPNGASNAADARSHFEQHIGRRAGGGADDTGIPKVNGLRACCGRGHVTLEWEPVPGAVGYLVHRAARHDGPFEPIDHGGNDVLAVPHPPYVDTSGVRDHGMWYAVATLFEATRMGALSEPVLGTADSSSAAGVHIRVRADDLVGALHRPWRPMIGSERLSLMLSDQEVGGRSIGSELTQALSQAHTELGVETVRAHAILHDDLHVYREEDGHPVHDFSGIDRVYDAVLATGLRPVVELSYMPRDLASDPSRTVFSYGGGISPPHNWDRWADLIRSLVEHLVDRYGLDEVRDRWSFEVWNEANLDVFWSGSTDDYLRLYDVTVAAIRAVDDGLVVGGPSSAAAQWIELLLDHVAESGAPVDFLSTHTYGSPPLDLRPILARHQRQDAEIWWTEWGPGSQHFHLVGDSVFAATFLIEGMVSSMGRLNALAHWVVSDHFEELGRPTKLAHGGFGLLTVGNLRKPRWWALALLERLGDSRLQTSGEGDGAMGLVKTVASKAADGQVGVLVWNSSLDQSRGSDEMLGRDVTVTITGLAAGPVTLSHYRVDEQHSNVFSVWRLKGGDERDWPADEEEWSLLSAGDGLAAFEPPRQVKIGRDGQLSHTFPLPHPGISYLEIIPGG